MIDHNAVMSREALTRAVEQAFPVIFQRLERRFRDPQLAEEVSRDCLSEAFERWQKDPAFFTHHDLTAWTSTRAGWRAIDRLRQRNRHATLPDEHPTDENRPLATGLSRFDPDAEQRLEERRRTWEALQLLDELDRRVLIGHYYDGRSDQDLGTELFGESGTLTARGLRVWRLRQKAQARLRDLLLAGGIDAEASSGQAV
jgi:RNA polymerase sigma factor (sigma-70 family)